VAGLGRTIIPVRTLTVSERLTGLTVLVNRLANRRITIDQFTLRVRTESSQVVFQDFPCSFIAVNVSFAAQCYGLSE